MTLEEVLAEAGIPWPTRGRKIHCPHHVDKTPSLHLYDDDLGGHWYCFSCHKHGLPGDLLFAYTGRWPKGKGARGLMDRTEATAGLSVWGLRAEVTDRKRQLGAELTETARAILPASVLPTWLVYLGDVEADLEADLRGAPPFEAHKHLDRFAHFVEDIEWLLRDVCASVAEWISQSNPSPQDFNTWETKPKASSKP